MTWPINFGGLAAGNQPLSLLDQMFAQVAAMINIPCTAVGTNAIALTPNANAPTLTSYANFNNFSFLAVATSTGNVTLQFATLGFLPVYLADGVTQVGANNILTGQFYTVFFSQALNSGGGGFYLVSPPVPRTTVSAGGSFANLHIANNASFPDTQVDVACDEIVMVSPGGSVVRSTGILLTINSAVNGANGLDVGGLASGQWYSVWLISNGSTTAGLMSLSFSSPTMPGGYTFKKRVGAVRSDTCAGQSSAVTITNASPGVVTWNASNLVSTGPVSFTAGGGTLPAQITAGTQYYVSPQGLTANSFSVSVAPLGPAINTTGGSGTVNAATPSPRIKRFQQFGNRAQYQVVPGSSVSQLPILAQGAQTSLGTYSTTAPTWAILAVGAYVPPTAGHIGLIAGNNSISGSAGQLQVAPNGTYGGAASAIGNVPFWDTFNASPTFHTLWRIGDMLLEGGGAGNIFWAATTAACTLWVSNWVDNL